mgnify:CR=1 FL=1
MKKIDISDGISKTVDMMWGVHMRILVKVELFTRLISRSTHIIVVIKKTHTFYLGKKASFIQQKSEENADKGAEKGKEMETMPN